MTIAQSPRLLTEITSIADAVAEPTAYNSPATPEPAAILDSAKQSALDYLRASGDGLNYK